MFLEKSCVVFDFTFERYKERSPTYLTYEIGNSVFHPQHCEFRMRGHYHCLRPGCFFITNITTKLPWHVKKHEKAERRAANGFKYFTKREVCGRLGKEKSDIMKVS